MVSERWFTADVRRIWQKCTTRQGLESWWSPEDLRTIVTRFDAHRGGEVAMTLRYVPAMLEPGGEARFRAAGIPIALELRGRVLELEQNRRIVFELTLSLDRGGTGVTNVTSLELEPVGSGTKVRIQVTGTGRSEPHMATLGKANLEGQLDRLARSINES